ncbi:putative thiol oxidoreductase [Leptolyngbya sp. PCC 7375]|nr:putative thiol oxidoreductase [Leptolyngbya sp. PCC 7375]
MSRQQKQRLRWVQQIASVGLVSVFLTFGGLFTSNAFAQTPVFNSDVDIDQGQLLKGGYTLRKVLESGGQFFSIPYTPDDHVGEGADGPRAKQRKIYYPHADINFLKLNGIGAQSCFECHHSIGTYREPGTTSQAMLRKPAAAGGSAGFASNAYINPDFPQSINDLKAPIESPEDGRYYPITELIRNPPHIFGTGYTQQLATEMTYGLQLLKDKAYADAVSTPGTRVSESLTVRGVDFGVFSTICPRGAACNPKTGTGFDDDTSEVVGVAADLVIRPFQWKGISSSVRHFARDAMDFHFSMQAEEKVGYVDCDRDGFPGTTAITTNNPKTNEVTVGNLSALTSFVVMTRPPEQVWPTDKASMAQAKRGETLFSNLGSGLSRGQKPSMSCATCHITQMKIAEPSVLVANPPKSTVLAPKDCPAETGNGLIAPKKPGELEVTQLYQQAKAAVGDAIPDPAQGVEESIKVLIDEERHQNVDPNLGYLINLTPTDDDRLPSYVYDRLPQNKDGSITIPLFSDLKTHNMGVGLSDITAQAADVEGISIPKENFLTRPLWGVGDTGPWLHDGRARSLEEAIMYHGSDGSEAEEVVKAFSELSSDDQDAIVEYLLTLQLPVQKNLMISNSGAGS